MLKQLSLLLLICSMAGCATTSNKTVSNKQDLANKADSHQSAHGEQWLTDMEKARAMAKAEGKELLILVTGSDWCHWCIILADNVLNQPEFLGYAKDHLVLVELDFPTEEVEMSEAQKAHNEKWKAKLTENVPFDGYPSLYLTDIDLKPYALPYFEEKDPKKYVEKLDEARAQKTIVAELSAKAAKASGLERAKLLDKLLACRDKTAIIADVSAKEQEIIDLTKGKDKALHNKYTVVKMNNAFLADMDLVGQEAGDSMPTPDNVIAVYEKHKAVKSGEILLGFISYVTDCFFDVKKMKEGAAFMEKMSSDMSYPLDIRQASRLSQGKLIAYQGDDQNERAIAVLKQVIEMDPKSQFAKDAEESIKDYSEKSDT